MAFFLSSSFVFVCVCVSMVACNLELCRCLTFQGSNFYLWHHPTRNVSLRKKPKQPPKKHKYHSRNFPLKEAKHLGILVGVSRSSRTGIEKLRASFLGQGSDLVDEELLRQAMVARDLAVAQKTGTKMEPW